MEELVFECQIKMEKTVESLKNQLVSLRTGRASAAVLNNIEIDYYGSMMPINQIASITSPEPRQLLIKPYDKGDLKAIITAINASDLGINPINGAKIGCKYALVETKLAIFSSPIKYTPVFTKKDATTKYARILNVFSNAVAMIFVPHSQPN